MLDAKCWMLDIGCYAIVRSSVVRQLVSGIKHRASSHAKGRHYSLRRQVEPDGPR
jgi:hypothetical protein